VTQLSAAMPDCDRRLAAARQRKPMKGQQQQPDVIQPWTRRRQTDRKTANRGMRPPSLTSIKTHAVRLWCGP